MPAAIVTDSLTWKEGDFALVSCDGTRCRIDAIHLKAAG
jgi:hypothetical protein